MTRFIRYIFEHDVIASPDVGPKKEDTISQNEKKWSSDRRMKVKKHLKGIGKKLVGRKAPQVEKKRVFHNDRPKMKTVFKPSDDKTLKGNT
jgi:hypothetical protein